MQEKIWRVVIFALAAIAFFGAPFSMFVFGSELTTRQSTLYPYQSSIEIQDDFIGGITTSGSIGEIGFSSAGTITRPASTGSNIGVVQIDTSAVSATQARINFGQNSVVYDPALPHAIRWIAKLNTNDANTLVRIGASNPVQNNPPTNGIYFEKLDADTNWFCVSRSGGVETRVDSSVSINTSYHTFNFTRNSSGVFFSIDNTSVCGTVTTNIPTTFIDPVVFILNSAAASKTIEVDYFQFNLYGLQR